MTRVPLPSPEVSKRTEPALYTGESSSERQASRSFGLSSMISDAMQRENWSQVVITTKALPRPRSVCCLRRHALTIS